MTKNKFIKTFVRNYVAQRLADASCHKLQPFGECQPDIFENVFNCGMAEAKATWKFLKKKLKKKKKND